ncbi:hypothetical protein [Methylosinus sp. PW1]|uniref:hypothetical protein n=1 Tax=Methylosinus sp. PW1 TaxID=107636 RepID=UPI000560336E|nr:hypothetical protein [Methylosinus sp. PW1]
MRINVNAERDFAAAMMAEMGAPSRPRADDESIEPTFRQRKDLDRAAVKRMYLEGMRVRHIAVELGVADNAIYYILYKFGIIERKPRKFSPEETKKRIAAKLDEPQRRALRWFQANGGVGVLTHNRDLLSGGKVCPAPTPALHHLQRLGLIEYRVVMTDIGREMANDLAMEGRCDDTHS